MVDDGRSGRDRQDVEMAEGFADLARLLLEQSSLEDTLSRVCSMSVDLIDGCHHAGVTWITGRRTDTRGASDEVPELVDAIQYETGQGPCLDAIRLHAVIHVNDLSREDRWPEFARRAQAETGVQSMLSFRLFAGGDTMGALNLYSREADAFDENADRIGTVLAAHAAVAISGARATERNRAETERRNEAIRTRDVIGQAKGMLMAREGVTEDEAFEILRRASQRLNSKLRDIADDMAAGRPPRAGND